MSTIQVGLPAAYPWVLLVASCTPFLTMWQTSLVGKGRKQSGIKYPQMYATKEQEEASDVARKFNCTQRAHQNTVENLNQFIVTLFIAGLKWPRLAAVAGTVFLAGRVIYTVGYVSGTPNKRIPGAAVSYLGFLPLLFGALSSSYGLLKQTGFEF